MDNLLACLLHLLPGRLRCAFGIVSNVLCRLLDAILVGLPVPSLARLSPVSSMIRSTKGSALRKSMTTRRELQTATLVNDGRVLIADCGDMNVTEWPLRHIHWFPDMYFFCSVFCLNLFSSRPSASPWFVAN